MHFGGVQHAIDIGGLDEDHCAAIGDHVVARRDLNVADRRPDTFVPVSTIRPASGARGDAAANTVKP
jgi:hypothetical protein